MINVHRQQPPTLKKGGDVGEHLSLIQAGITRTHTHRHTQPQMEPKPWHPPSMKAAMWGNNYSLGTAHRQGSLARIRTATHMRQPKIQTKPQHPPSMKAATWRNTSAGASRPERQQKWP